MFQIETTRAATVEEHKEETSMARPLAMFWPPLLPSTGTACRLSAKMASR